MMVSEIKNQVKFNKSTSKVYLSYCTYVMWKKAFMPIKPIFNETVAHSGMSIHSHVKTKMYLKKMKN